MKLAIETVLVYCYC